VLLFPKNGCLSTSLPLVNEVSLFSVPSQILVSDHMLSNTINYFLMLLNGRTRVFALHKKKMLVVNFFGVIFFHFAKYCI